MTQAGGRWLRIWLVVDAMLVLCGGMFTGKDQPTLNTNTSHRLSSGLLSGCAVLEKLAQDRVLPMSFAKSMPITGATHISLIFFATISGAIYGSSLGRLEIVSLLWVHSS